MGQYHVPINLDKREYLSPHALGDGLKLLEQSLSGPGGIPTAIHILLAVSNGRGGGDYNDGVLHGSSKTHDEVPEGAEITIDNSADGGYIGWILNDEFAELAKNVVGRWGGDRIAIVGDYAEYEDLPEGMAPLAYSLCGTHEEVRSTIKFLTESGDPANRDRAIALTAQLESYGPYTDITSMVREYMKNCDAYYHTFSYGDGGGWIKRNFDLERRAGV